MAPGAFNAGQPTTGRSLRSSRRVLGAPAPAHLPLPGGQAGVQAVPKATAPGKRFLKGKAEDKASVPPSAAAPQKIGGKGKGVGHSSPRQTSSTSKGKGKQRVRVPAIEVLSPTPVEESQSPTPKNLKRKSAAKDLDPVLESASESVQTKRQKINSKDITKPATARKCAGNFHLSGVYQKTMANASPSVTRGRRPTPVRREVGESSRAGAARLARLVSPAAAPVEQPPAKSTQKPKATRTTTSSKGKGKGKAKATGSKGKAAAKQSNAERSPTLDTITLLTDAQAATQDQLLSNIAAMDRAPGDTPQRRITRNRSPHTPDTARAAPRNRKPPRDWKPAAGMPESGMGKRVFGGRKATIKRPNRSADVAATVSDDAASCNTFDPGWNEYTLGDNEHGNRPAATALDDGEQEEEEREGGTEPRPRDEGCRPRTARGLRKRSDTPSPPQLSPFSQECFDACLEL